MLTSSDLPLPDLLCRLIASGFWPANQDQAHAQNLKMLVSLDRVKAFAPEEEAIYFNSPPFHTIKYRKNHGEEWFWNWPGAAVHELDAELTLLIGDFGIGSDAPIALDYRRDRANPSVIRLKYLPSDGKGEIKSYWVEIAPTFDDFASMIGVKAT